MKNCIFISYSRFIGKDSQEKTIRFYQRKELEQKIKEYINNDELSSNNDLALEIKDTFEAFGFDKKHRFFDLESTAPGEDFEKIIKKSISESRFFVAVLTPEYLREKLGDEKDYTFLELKYALSWWRSLRLNFFRQRAFVVPICKQSDKEEIQKRFLELKQNKNSKYAKLVQKLCRLNIVTIPDGNFAQKVDVYVRIIEQSFGGSPKFSVPTRTAHIMLHIKMFFIYLVIFLGVLYVAFDDKINPNILNDDTAIVSGTVPQFAQSELQSVQTNGTYSSESGSPNSSTPSTEQNDTIAKPSEVSVTSEVPPKEKTVLTTLQIIKKRTPEQAKIEFEAVDATNQLRIINDFRNYINHCIDLSKCAPPQTDFDKWLVINLKAAVEEAQKLHQLGMTVNELENYRMDLVMYFADIRFHVIQELQYVISSGDYEKALSFYNTICSSFDKYKLVYITRPVFGKK